MSSTSHRNAKTLAAVYRDLSNIGQYLAQDAILHPANRQLVKSTDVVRGIDAIVLHEKALIDAMENTLLMDVESIIANAYFGAVLGLIRARPEGRFIRMPFCGLWRFRDGLIVEHWENAYDVASLNDI